MGTGSGTLGLLFKIGVDVSGVKDAFKEGFGRARNRASRTLRKPLQLHSKKSATQLRA